MALISSGDAVVYGMAGLVFQVLKDIGWKRGEPPWSVIVRRIEAAASADFVIGLYNPASGRRTRQIVEAQSIIRRHRVGETPVALVKSAYRKLQDAMLTDLDHFLDYEIGMLTTVLVGSSNTYAFEGYMVTPRGYSNKYTNDGEALPGQRPGFSLNPDAASHQTEER